ncbi:UNVERIFIED_CONTAM: hypothetical protein GTU68_017118 [Idotea baltica]|nr:hypothetical protein [Idotea baltica]
MLTSDTRDAEACVAEALGLTEAGCEIVRVTAQTKKIAQNLEHILKGLRDAGCEVPIVADIHFKPDAAMEAAKWVEKVRVNPGNYARIEEKFGPLVDYCIEHNVAMRIGTNHGSLSDRIMNRYGDTPLGMVESALEFARIARDRNYHNFVFSMKASNPKVMIEAYRLLTARLAEEGEDWNYPIHLGVTEAGDGEDGRIKSAIGIGSLLHDGVGDTIRVSGEEAPGQSLRMAYNILQAAGARIFKTDYVACPSCGRTLFNLQTTTQKIREATGHLKGVRIAVMGCIVNGPGEMADADFGYVGGAPNKINLYVGKEPVKFNIPEAEAVDRLIDLIKEHDRWIEAPTEVVESV